MLRLSTKAKFDKQSSYPNTTIEIIYFPIQVDIESTDTLFSDLENKYKLLGAKSKQIVNALKTAKISPLFRTFKETKRRQVKDELTSLKTILHEMKN